MKRIILGTVCAVTALLFLMACNRGGTTPTAGTAASAWEPTRRVEWVLTVNPGGGNDIFTRAIIGILKDREISDADFVVNYQTDGHGEVARLRVSRLGADAYTLLGFTSGEFEPMLGHGNLTMDSFTVLALLASDKHILLVRNDSRIQSIDRMIDDVRNRRTISGGGAMNDDMQVFYMMLEALNLNADDFPYIAFGSNVDALAALLGGHIDVAVSKLAACEPYLLSGDLVPIAALANERFTLPPFDTAQTLSELGYTNVENPLWRAILGSPGMPSEAVEYYIRILREMSQTAEWDQYITDRLSTPMYYFGEDARRWIMDYQRSLGL